MHVYFDNAATTPMEPQVIDAMADAMKNVFGNASAIHGQGRKAKATIELARKQIADLLNCNSSEIIFTGSGTEADNMALRCAVNDLGVTTIITSPIEHKAVLDTAIELEKKGLVNILYTPLDEFGRPHLNELSKLCADNPGALVSLMHANNEIGTLLDLQKASAIARANNCFIHSDTVQTIGHYCLDLQALDLDFLTCSAHKFHGPKGVGFLYKNKKVKITPIITGGGQESKMRAGTENVTGIVGLAKALEVCCNQLELKIAKVSNLKQYMKQQLKQHIEGICFNGDTSKEGGLYTVLNVSFPPSTASSTLLFMLDINNICVSGGSACNSGAVGKSHVLEGIHHPEDRTAVRFSFSKYNTKEEVDFVVQTLKELLSVTPVTS
jgi:cysteine desulfurase